MEPNIIPWHPDPPLSLLMIKELPIILKSFPCVLNSCLCRNRRHLFPYGNLALPLLNAFFHLFMCRRHCHDFFSPHALHSPIISPLLHSSSSSVAITVFIFLPSSTTPDRLKPKTTKPWKLISRT